MTEKIHTPYTDEKSTWLDNPKNIDYLLWVFYGLCALVADLFDYWGLFQFKHPKFDAEYFPNFYGFYGFLCFVFIVFAGKLLRKIVMRDEDYYDR